MIFIRKVLETYRGTYIKYCETQNREAHY